MKDNKNLPDISDIEAIFADEDNDNFFTLTEEQAWRLINYECVRGGVTLDELREIRETHIWPKGKDNIYVHAAEMLLCLVEP